MSTTLYGQYDLERGIADSISLESSYSLTDEQEDDDELQVHTVHGVLVQINKLKGIATRHAVVNDHYLLVYIKSIFSERRYWVHLGYIGNKPGRRIILAWDWLTIAAGFASVTAAAYVYLPKLDFPYRPYVLLGLLIGCTMLAAISLLPFFYQSRYRQVHRSRRGNVTFVELIPGCPNRREYRRFTELLEACKERARKAVDPANELAGEVREHRRLYEAGVIDRKVYDRAKRIIFMGA